MTNEEPEKQNDNVALALLSWVIAIFVYVVIWISAVGYFKKIFILGKYSIYDWYLFLFCLLAIGYVTEILYQNVKEHRGK